MAILKGFFQQSLRDESQRSHPVSHMENLFLSRCPVLSVGPQQPSKSSKDESRFYFAREMGLNGEYLCKYIPIENSSAYHHRNFLRCTLYLIFPFAAAHLSSSYSGEINF